MTHYATPKLGPIQFQQEYGERCAECGAVISDCLLDVDDEDPATGYRDARGLCPDCLDADDPLEAE